MTEINKDLVEDKRKCTKINKNIVSLNFEEFFIIIRIISYVSFKKFDVKIVHVKNRNKLTKLNKNLIEDRRKCIKINKNIISLNFEKFLIIIRIISYVLLKKFEIRVKDRNNLIIN